MHDIIIVSSWFQFQDAASSRFMPTVKMPIIYKIYAISRLHAFEFSFLAIDRMRG